MPRPPPSRFVAPLPVISDQSLRAGPIALGCRGRYKGRYDELEISL